MPDLEKASSVLARVGARLLQVLEQAAGQVDVAATWTALEQVASREQIATAVATAGELVPDESGAEVRCVSRWLTGSGRSRWP